MLELAITRGADFVRYTRNAKVIELPDGCTVLGPLTALPHVAGDYAIRSVVLDGPEPGPLEIGGTAPPVVDGDVVVIRRTVTPKAGEQVAAILAATRQKRIDELRALLDAVDVASARPLRAIVAGTATEADRTRLMELEARATGLRADLASV